MSRWTYRFKLTQHRAVDLSSYQFIRKIINTSKLTIIWSNLSVKYLEKIVDCYPQSDASDGIEQPASLFLVLYSSFCPHWSASGKPWSTTDDAAEATDDFFTFLPNQEHGVNNERSQSIQSARHSKRTHHMWLHHKDRGTRKQKERR